MGVWYQPQMSELLMNGRCFSTLIGMAMLLSGLLLAQQPGLKSMAMDPLLSVWLLLLGGCALQGAALYRSIGSPEARPIERWFIVAFVLVSLGILVFEVI